MSALVIQPVPFLKHYALPRMLTPNILISVYENPPPPFRLSKSYLFHEAFPEYSSPELTLPSPPFPQDMVYTQNLSPSNPAPPTAPSMPQCEHFDKYILFEMN